MTEAAAAPRSPKTMWRYTRPFRVDGRDYRVVLRSRTDGLASQLEHEGVVLATDHTPIGGPDAVRNHRLAAALPDGRPLEVEAGYVSLWTVGIRATVDGRVVHESHPGRTIAYPERYREKTAASKAETLGEALTGGGGDPDVDLGIWRRNRVPLAVDISMGLIFFALAKLTDLTTAALVSAGLGVGLVVAQRFVKVDLVGGLALFGVAMALVSAALALAFQDDMMVKLRGVLLGLISASLFLGDGLLLRGRRLGAGLARYVPFTDLDPRRLSIGMGVLGLVLAATSWAAARFLTTDLWLYYTTFGDILLVMVLGQFAFAYARGRLFKS